VLPRAPRHNYSGIAALLFGDRCAPVVHKYSRDAGLRAIEEMLRLAAGWKIAIHRIATSNRLRLQRDFRLLRAALR
jgi:hypothetical protein